MENHTVTPVTLAVHHAIGRIAARCDYASKLDGAGFSKFDAEFGHKLAGLDPAEWSPKMTYTAWKICRRYRRQLALEGIEFAEMVEPPNPYDGTVTVHPDDVAAPVQTRATRETTDRRCSLTRDRAGNPIEFVVTFAYNPGLVEAVKRLPERRWDADARQWLVPASLDVLPALAEFLRGYGFHGDADTVYYLQESLLGAEEARLQQEAMAEASRAHTSIFEVAGLGGELRPFQRAGVEYATKAKRLIVGDEMGLGKTVEALATLESLGAYPAVIVCPASLKPNWKREITKWLPHRSLAVLNGGGDLLARVADIVVLNYDVLGKFEDFLTSRTWAALVADESHYAKSPGARRTKLLDRLAHQFPVEGDAVAKPGEIVGIPVRLLLTGTPVLNTPEELLAQLRILDRLEDLGGLARFKKRYVWGMRFQELNEKMRALCYLRREKAQVLTELPPKVRAIVPLPIDNWPEYEYAYDEIIAYIEQRAKADETFLASIADLTGKARAEAISQHAKEAGERAARALVLVKLNALKRLVAKGKLSAAIGWIKDFLANGEKLVVFAHHVEVQEALRAEFPGCARLAAEDNADERQAEVDRFQTDSACRIIVCSIGVGGLGHTLTAASNVATLELEWTPAAHSQAEDRCHRIGQHDSVTSYYLLAEGTIDDKIMALLDKKLTVVTAVTEGGAVAPGTLLGELLADLRGVEYTPGGPEDEPEQTS